MMRINEQCAVYVVHVMCVYQWYVMELWNIIEIQIYHYNLF